MIEVLIVAAGVSAVILILILRGRTLAKKKPSVPTIGYRLFYSDQKNDLREKTVVYSKLLKSEKYSLSGKPDFIYKKNGSESLLPVELKSGKIGNAMRPHEGDLMQLAAYFLIIEDVYGTRPKHGRLIYSDWMFTVKNTRSLRNSVLHILKEMRDVLENGPDTENNSDFASFAKCKHCVCRETVCELYDRLK